MPGSSWARGRCARQIRNSGAGKSICHKARGVNAARRNHPPNPPAALPGAQFCRLFKARETPWRAPGASLLEFTSERRSPLESAFATPMAPEICGNTPGTRSRGRHSQFWASMISIQGAVNEIHRFKRSLEIFFFSLEEAVKSRIKRGRKVPRVECQVQKRCGESCLSYMQGRGRGASIFRRN